MNQESISLHNEDHVATLALSRPERLNALDETLLDGLAKHLAALARDEDVRCVVLTGRGRAFCSGGDLRALTTTFPERPSEGFLSLAARFHECILELRDMPKPIVASINGPAVGGGFSLALACDYRVMADDAFLQLGYPSQGLSIDGGGSHHLARMVGVAKALEIALFDERIPAAQAKELGLVNAIVPRERLEAETRAISTRLVARATGAIGRAKRLFHRAFDASLESQLERERRELGRAADSAEGREGMRAFLEKYAPDFLSAAKKKNV